MENFQGPYQESNTEPPVLLKSVPTNCATAHPLVCVTGEKIKKVIYYSLSSTLPHVCVFLMVLCMARYHTSTISAATSLASSCSDNKVHSGDVLNGLICQ